MQLFTLGAMYDFSPEIFDGVSDGVTAELDGKVLHIGSMEIVEAILFRCEMLKTIKNSPNELRKAIYRWWNIKQQTFARMLKTTMYEYNPIHNYDREEIWTNTQKRSGTGSGTNGGNITEQRRGFNNGVNTDTLIDSEKSINSATTSTNYSDNGELKHSASIKGNIGVTTTQDMLTAERNIAHYSVLENIAENFKSNFCIVVY